MSLLLDMIRDEPNAVAGAMAAALAAAAILIWGMWRDETRIAAVRRDRERSAGAPR